MYLQITTKCNMTCDHCCYSCDMQGDHMEWDTFVDSIVFCRDYTENISIGGGEPTLHPKFFDFLRVCLEDFDYVWMATNGSQTETMWRLANIIDGEDYPDCDCDEDTLDEYGCLCHEKIDYDSIYQEDKLSVALSHDCFHDEINQKIVNFWSKRANIHRHSHFEIRDVSHNVIAMGRAADTGVGWVKDDCVCADLVIKPNGDIKLCGCDNAPVIGNVASGIEEKWEEVLNDDAFRYTDCYNGWLKHKEKSNENKYRFNTYKAP